MKKILLSLTALFVGFVASAQDSFYPGWQFGFMTGATYTSGMAPFNQLVTAPVLAASALYQVTPVFTVRGELSGYKSKGVIAGNAYRFNYVQMNADALFDVLNIFNFKSDRFASPYLLAGLGLNVRFNNGAAAYASCFEDPSFIWTRGVLGFTQKVGVGVLLRISDAIAVNVELADNFHSNRFNSRKDVWDVDQNLNLLAGVRLSFGQASRRRSANSSAQICSAPCSIRCDKAPEVSAPAGWDSTYLPKYKSTVLFHIGSFTLYEKAMSEIREIAGILKENSAFKVNLSGYADKGTGFPELNMRLSKNRAEAVRDALVEEGIDSSRISVEYWGDTRSVSETPSENRTVICVIK